MIAGNETTARERNHMTRHTGYLAASLLILATVCADAQDTKPVNPIPPPGIKIPEEIFKELKKGTVELGKEIDDLRKSLAKKQDLLDLLPDVQIFYYAVYYALRYEEFHAEKEVEVARKLLAQGRDRAKSLRDGKAPWNTAVGPVVRGYRSKIDGSIQPYGIIVPANFVPGLGLHHRLDVWWHGRGEKLSELSFLAGRLGDKNLFVPHGFVMHPYGRYCNANHFAGEIDTFEAIEHARKHYPIDFNRVVARGYSMGGAACWGYAVHYPGLWAAAQPGAGFSETPEFLRVFANETINPNAWEKKLLHLYDCTDWAGNLYNLPTVAFSNEAEKQRQAADIMAQAMLKENLHLVHVLAPGAAHKYPPPPKEKAELFNRIDSVVDKGRDPFPKRIKFTTYTLRYNAIRWVTVDELQEHWEQARLDVEIRGGRFLKGKGTGGGGGGGGGASQDSVAVKTKNVNAFTLAIPPGYSPFENQAGRPITVEIDGQEVAAPPVMSDRSWTSHFRRADGKWQQTATNDDGQLRKRHGLQGPIDDAFMDRFVMVKPTGTPMNAKVGQWIDSEMHHAVDHWRKQFRGELHPVDDAKVDDKTIASSNLVLWGDPQSNKVLAKIVDKLPIRWDAKEGVFVGKQAFAADHHVPVLIYPNPLNPKKYVVLNSGFTFREYDYLNNARQIPRLPDWAVLDIDQPRTPQRPAGIAEAGFFGERWELVGGK
jgi:hypothetical protein